MQQVASLTNALYAQRVKLLRKTEMWKKVSVQTVKEDLNLRFTRPAKKSEKAKDQTIEEQLLFGALGAQVEAGVFKYSDTFNAPGPGELHGVRKGLSQRFDSVYDAWVFLDLDGDWSLSHQGAIRSDLSLRVWRLA